MEVTNTERIRIAMHLIIAESSSQEEEEEEEEEKRNLLKLKLTESMNKPAIPYSLVKEMSDYKLMNKNNNNTNDHINDDNNSNNMFRLYVLLQGSQLILKKPKRREQKTVEFAQKLERIKNKIEEEKYNSMIEDVMKGCDDKQSSSSVSALIKNDLGLAIHVITLMFACFLGGYLCGTHVFQESSWEIHFVCGTLGSVACLFMEAALFIVRGVREDEYIKKKNPSSSSLSSSSQLAATAMHSKKTN